MVVRFSETSAEAEAVDDLVRQLDAVVIGYPSNIALAAAGRWFAELMSVVIKPSSLLSTYDELTAGYRSQLMDGLGAKKQ